MSDEYLRCGAWNDSACIRGGIGLGSTTGGSDSGGVKDLLRTRAAGQWPAFGTGFAPFAAVDWNVRVRATQRVIWVGVRVLLFALRMGV